MKITLSTSFWRGLCAAVLLMVPVLASAQQKTVKGVVSDQNGEPVISAVVMVEGTSAATTTGIDGAYSIQASVGQTLYFNCLGYKDVRVVVGDSSVINVTMSDDSSFLEEAVAIGYATIKKRDLTGSVASVGADAITKTIATSADQVLQGRAAGVQMVQNSGIPGGGSSIRVRGVSSIFQSSEPVIVIDGVVIEASTGSNTENALASINPNDIETMDILKDASATAIYGSRGANGVIIITTKRGKAGKAVVNLDAQVGVQTMAKYLDLMDLPMYAEHYNTFAELRGAPLRDEYVIPEALPAGTDWQRELFKPAAMQQYNLTVSGGNDSATYAVSAGYLDQDGIAYGSGFDRFTLRANTDIQARKWLKFGASLTASRSNQNINALASNEEGLIQVALKQSPAVSARSIDGGYDGPDDANFAQSNPLGLAKLLENHNKKAGIRSNIYAEATLLEGLTLRTEYSSDINITNDYSFVPTYKFGAIYNSENSNRQSKSFSEYWSLRGLLSYNKTIGDHSFSAMLGYERTKSQWEYIMARRLNGSDDMHSIRIGDVKTATNDGQIGMPNTLESWFGRVFYSFKDRYLLTATLRYDGTSSLPLHTRYDIFPSAAFAWRISEEPFIKDNFDSISNLKLRLGYGKVGNSNLPAMAWQATLVSSPTNWGTGFLTGRIPNENLAWEATDSYNVGIDLGLWKDRVTLVFDAYYKYINNLLMPSQLPAFVGTSGMGSAQPPYGNIGSLLNKGFDFTINTVNINKRDFSWTSSLVFSLNRNKVTKLNSEIATIDRTYQVSGTNTVVTRTRVGSSIGDFYGYNVIGRINDANDLYDKEGNLKVAIPANTTVNRDTGVWVGDWLFEDVSGDGVIDEKDRINLGSPLPLFTGGIGNTITWKNFDFNFYFTYSYGNKVMNWLRVTMDNPNASYNKFRRAKDYAKLELINPKGSDTDIYNVYVASAGKWMPRMSAGDVNDNDRVSSLYIEDGSYLRLQNLSIAYRLPYKVVEKLNISSARISLNIQNLFTLTRYTGYDPEIGMTMEQYSTNGQDALMNGIDTGRYPSPRIFTLGLNIGF